MPEPSAPHSIQVARPWETEETFHDVLYEWMSRAPWLAISGALHLVLALILAAIPWSAFEKADEQSFVADVEAPPDEEEKEPEPEVLDIVDPEVDPEPELDPIDPVESPDVVDTPYEDVAQGNDSNDDSPFEASDRSNAVLGIGSGATGKFGGRFGDGGKRGGGGGPRTNIAVAEGLAWLAAHQDTDGKWDCDEFFKHDPASDRTDGAGLDHDIGVTGLALLAFLGDGHTMTRGTYRDVVKKGIKWLIDEQDRETGLFGQEIGHAFLYDHSIATLAMCEAYFIDRSITLKLHAQKAIHYISRARNPYGVWRYEVPPNGDNDTSVTGWMIFAMKSAEEGRLKIDKEAYAAAIQWFDEMTDPGTGRVGYLEAGSPSSRVPGMNDAYPTDSGEALTAVALLCRFFLGQDANQSGTHMKDHAELLLRSLPRWDPEGLGCDMYYWYYGSYAMFQMGGKYWKAWNQAMKSAVVESQRRDGSAKGSWDPVGPWGYAGGRVYSTATMVLCLEVYYRYSRLAGAR